MKKKNSTKKKTTKKSSKMKKKKKKLLKSTENAIKKKMAPTKKTKYSKGNHKTVPDDITGALSGVGSIDDSVTSANDLADDMSNGDAPSDDDLENLATGKNAK